MDINYKTKLEEIAYSNFLNYTLRKMNELEIDSLKDSVFRNWIYENFNTAFINYNTLDFLKYVHTYVSSNIVYREDQYDETIISPRLIITQNFLYGDCDDISLLIKTILKFFNINAKYILFSHTWGNFTHIAVIVDLNNKLIYLDGVRNDFNILPVNKYSYFKII